MQKIVIKVGSSSLTYPTGLLNFRKIHELAMVISDLSNMGKDVVLVSSGAIAVGAPKLSLEGKPVTTREKQACAAVGQCELMNIYGDIFGQCGKTVAQLLLTRDVLDFPERKQNAEGTLQTLFAHKIIPIVNENDSIAVEEIEFGDNDTLSAYVAQLVQADILILLSDIDGLYDKNPQTNKDAKLIQYVDNITDEIKTMAGGEGSQWGTGGMLTKLVAAEVAMSSGVDMVITNSDNISNIYNIIEGKPIGTLFKAQTTK